MDPFAMAQEDLAQSDLAIDVVYQFGGSGPPIPCRMRLSRPGEAAGESFLRPGKISVAAIGIIAKADLRGQEPQEKDLIGQGTQGGWRVASVQQDAHGLSYMLGLRRRD